MSEQEEKTNITSEVKEKDPRRVEAGRKLGINSKKSKEDKRKKLEDGGYNLKFFAFALGVLVMSGTITYYVFSKKDNTADKTSEPTPKTRSKRYLEDD